CDALPHHPPISLDLRHRLRSMDQGRGGMAEALVACASCGTKLPLTDADVVPFGTGYRCQRCTTNAEVETHLEAAAANEAAQRNSRYEVRNPLEPTVADVRREVEAIRARREG